MREQAHGGRVFPPSLLNLQLHTILECRDLERRLTYSTFLARAAFFKAPHGLCGTGIFLAGTNSFGMSWGRMNDTCRARAKLE